MKYIRLKLMEPLEEETDWSRGSKCTKTKLLVFKRQLMRGCSIIKDVKSSRKIIKATWEMLITIKVCNLLKELNLISNGPKWLTKWVSIQLNKAWLTMEEVLLSILSQVKMFQEKDKVIPTLLKQEGLGCHQTTTQNLEVLDMLTKEEGDILFQAMLDSRTGLFVTPVI